MATRESMVRGSPDIGPKNRGSAEWVVGLLGVGPEHDRELAWLSELLLRVAYGEMRRRSSTTRLSGSDLNDLAQSAAIDAQRAITARLDQFRGDSRFTTWAYKFVMAGVATQLARYRQPVSFVDADTGDWDCLAARCGLDRDPGPDWPELVAAVSAGADRLEARLRQVFVAVVLQGIPLDVVAGALGAERATAYQHLYDARRRLRSSLFSRQLDRSGPAPGGDAPLIGWSRLDRFLRTDPLDAGCAETFEWLDESVEWEVDHGGADRRFPGLAAHLRACDACHDDEEGLLLAVGGLVG